VSGGSYRRALGAANPQSLSTNPPGVFGYLGDDFIVGSFPQQWFSMGRNGSKQTSHWGVPWLQLSAMRIKVCDLTNSLRRNMRL
jgi:hypothetical protein